MDRDIVYGGGDPSLARALARFIHEQLCLLCRHGRPCCAPVELGLGGARLMLKVVALGASVPRPLWRRCCKNPICALPERRCFLSEVL